MGIRKVWVGVSGVEVVASTSLAEVSRVIGCSVWTLRDRRRKDGEGGFTLVVSGKAGNPGWQDGTYRSWYIVRVPLRQVDGRGKAGKSGHRLKNTK